MITNSIFHMLMILVFITIIKASLALSYNQPKFCPSATWNPNATTFANSSIIGEMPRGIFVHSNNNIYIADQQNGRVQIWMNDSINPTRTVSGDLAQPWGLFVTENGDIYVDNRNQKGVDKRVLNTNITVSFTIENTACLGLFVDINDTLYCSLLEHHRVVKLWLKDNSTNFTTVAGTDSPNSLSNTLNRPFGIFVDINFDLYVADYENHRIQLFRSDQLNGTTVAGVRSQNTTITLNHPSGIVLDADKYLFIVDAGNNRIIGSGPNGFRCLVGCANSSGPGSNQLNQPRTLSFHRDGSMFVTDRDNHRVQKFHLSINTCNETMTTQAALTSTTILVTNSTALSTLNFDTSTATMAHEQETPSGKTTVKSISTIDFIDSTTNPSSLVPTSARAVLTLETTSSAKTTDKPVSKHFIRPSCNNSPSMGLTCNVSSSPCNMLDPCRNNGTCYNNGTGPHGYFCSCQTGFNGAQCQLDDRICKPKTCWNNAQCNETENGTFICTCQSGWSGIHCQTMINYCASATCMNDGVCRPLLGSYKCECLYGYSGDNCNITATKIIVFKIISKSFAYVAIIAMVIVVMFIVVMDILKYCFGIDPTREELERIRRIKQAKKRKPVIQRFIYVNAPQPSYEEPVSAAADTAV